MLSGFCPSQRDSDSPTFDSQLTRQRLTNRISPTSITEITASSRTLLVIWNKLFFFFYPVKEIDQKTSRYKEKGRTRGWSRASSGESVDNLHCESPSTWKRLRTRLTRRRVCRRRSINMTARTLAFDDANMWLFICVGGPIVFWLRSRFRARIASIST